MTKAKFIEELRTMADNLEQGSYHFIDLKSGYIFANKNYGEVHCTVADGVALNVNLYTTSDDEKEGEVE